jgi:hypothetical protein
MGNRLALAMLSDPFARGGEVEWEEGARTNRSEEERNRQSAGGERNKAAEQTVCFTWLLMLPPHERVR